MASLGQEFNVADLPENTGFLSIDPGWYTVTIDSADVKPTKSGTGMSTGYKINGPTNAGRLIFGFINLTNANSECERIGRGDLGALSRAVGIAKINDSDQLLGKSLEIQVTKEKDSSQYADENGFRNNIKSYRALKGVSLGDSPTEKAPSGVKPPWA